MNIRTTPPSTLDGIKKLAKSIKRELGSAHHEALAVAAQRAGFQNYAHARRALGGPVDLHDIYLTAYWRDRGPPRTAGRETLHLQLPTALTALVRRHELSTARLRYAKLEADDHLELRQDVVSQAAARSALLSVARALQFIQVTGLRPATRREQITRLQLEGMPTRDHASWWVDPETGATVALDEPYGPPVQVRAARAEWLAQHDIALFAPTWAGLYAPNHATPFLHVHERHLAVGERACAALDRLGRAPALTWEGMSERYDTRFHSPSRQGRGTAPGRRTMPAWPGTVRAEAVAFGGAPGIKGRWRPAQPMRFEMHVQAARLLHDMGRTPISRRADDHVSEVRSTLDDWYAAEHPEPARAGRDLYYGGDSRQLDDAEFEAAARDLIEIIKDGYHDCMPRRRLIGTLEAVRNQLRKRAA